MVKIRLVRLGAKKKPFYQIVVADSRCPRNGKFIEKIGFFNPLANSKNSNNLFLNSKKITSWINNGALISKRIKSLIKNYPIK